MEALEATPSVDVPSGIFSVHSEPNDPTRGGPALCAFAASAEEAESKAKSLAEADRDMRFFVVELPLVTARDLDALDMLPVTMRAKLAVHSR